MTVLKPKRKSSNEKSGCFADTKKPRYYRTYWQSMKPFWNHPWDTLAASIFKEASRLWCFMIKILKVLDTWFFPHQLTVETVAQGIENQDTPWGPPPSPHPCHNCDLGRAQLGSIATNRHDTGTLASDTTKTLCKCKVWISMGELEGRVGWSDQNFWRNMMKCMPWHEWQPTVSHVLPRK